MTAAPKPACALYCPPRAMLAQGLEQLYYARLLSLDADFKYDRSDPTTFRVTLDGLQLTMSSVGEDCLRGVFRMSKIGTHTAVTFVPEEVPSEHLTLLWGPDHRWTARILFELANDLWAAMKEPQPDLSPPLLKRSNGTAREEEAIADLAHQMATKPKRIRGNVISEIAGVYGLTPTAAERVWSAAVERARKINPDHGWDRPTGRPKSSPRALETASTS